MMELVLGGPGDRGRPGRLRKVRAPQGTAPGNPRAGRPADRATETDRLGASRGQGEKVA